MKAKQIEWKDGPYGIEIGAVSGIRLFSIDFTSSGSAEKPYYVTTDLPGYKKGAHCATVAQAKQVAQATLEAFVKKLVEE